MNDRDERLIAGLAEIKAELVSLTRHVETQNSSVAQHFADDLAWQQAHDRREVARDLAVIEAAAERAVEVAEAKGYRRGLLWPIGVAVAVFGLGGGTLGPVISRLLFGD